MIQANFHTHTNYVDGKNTPEEMVLAALERDMRALGFSEHAYIDLPEWPDPCWMSPPQTAAYASEVRALAEKYAGRIDLYCGLELDSAGPCPDRAGWDYFIGSVHMVPVQGTFVAIDQSAAAARKGVETLFGGDPYAYTGAYFAAMTRMVAAFRPDILGHFDLPTKFLEQDPLFDPDDPRFVEPALAALDAALGLGCIVEINTGAMSRGFRTAPYPAPRFLKHVREQGGRICLSADAHSAGAIDHAFDTATALARRVGFTEAMVYTKQGFVPMPL